MQKRKAITKLMWGILLAVTAYAWLIYTPFISGIVPNVYPLALMYSYVFAWPAFYTILSFPVSFVVAVVVSGGSAWFKRRHYLLPRLFKGGIAFLVMCVGLYPALLHSLERGPSLTIASWDRTYHVAFHSAPFQEFCLTPLVISCDATGLFCSVEASVSVFDTDRTTLDLSYSQESDHLSLQSADNLLYQRDRDTIFVNQTDVSCE